MWHISVSLFLYRCLSAVCLSLELIVPSLIWTATLFHGPIFLMLALWILIKIYPNNSLHNEIIISSLFQAQSSHDVPDHSAPALASPTRAQLISLLESFKSSVGLQEKTADHVAKRYLLPLGNKLHRGDKGKVTLAEMTRHFRMDRIIETLEGTLWVEKQLLEESTIEHINLNALLYAKWKDGIAEIKVVRNLMRSESWVGWVLGMIKLSWGFGEHNILAPRPCWWHATITPQ